MHPRRGVVERGDGLTSSRSRERIVPEHDEDVELAGGTQTAAIPSASSSIGMARSGGAMSPARTNHQASTSSDSDTHSEAGTSKFSHPFFNSSSALPWKKFWILVALCVCVILLFAVLRMSFETSKADWRSVNLQQVDSSILLSFASQHDQRKQLYIQTNPAPPQLREQELRRTKVEPLPSVNGERVRYGDSLMVTSLKNTQSEANRTIRYVSGLPGLPITPVFPAEQRMKIAPSRLAASNPRFHSYLMDYANRLYPDRLPPGSHLLNTIEKKVIYVYDDLCGGFGDQTRGMASAFLIALLTNRAFYVEFGYPTPEIQGSKFWFSSYFDWRWPSKLRPGKAALDNWMVLDCAVSECSPNRLIEYLNKNQTRAGHAMFLSGNPQWHLYLPSQLQYVDKFKEMGLDKDYVEFLQHPVHTGIRLRAQSQLNERDKKAYRGYAIPIPLNETLPEIATTPASTTGATTKTEGSSENDNSTTTATPSPSANTTATTAIPDAKERMRAALDYLQIPPAFEAGKSEYAAIESLSKWNKYLLRDRVYQETEKVSYMDALYMRADWQATSSAATEAAAAVASGAAPAESQPPAGAGAVTDATGPSATSSGLVYEPYYMRPLAKPSTVGNATEAMSEAAYVRLWSALEAQAKVGRQTELEGLPGVYNQMYGAPGAVVDVGPDYHRRVMGYALMAILDHHTDLLNGGIKELLGYPPHGKVVDTYDSSAIDVNGRVRLPMTIAEGRAWANKWNEEKEKERVSTNNSTSLPLNRSVEFILPNPSSISVDVGHDNLFPPTPMPNSKFSMNPHLSAFPLDKSDNIPLLCMQIRTGVVAKMRDGESEPPRLSEAEFVPMYSFGVHTLRRHLRERNALALAQRAALLKEQEKIVEQHIRNINNTIGKTEGWSDNDEIRVRAEDVVLPASIKTLRQYTVYVASDSVHVRAILKSLCEKDPDCLHMQFMPTTPLHIIKSTEKTIESFVPTYSEFALFSDPGICDWFVYSPSGYSEQPFHQQLVMKGDKWGPPWAFHQITDYNFIYEQNKAQTAKAKAEADAQAQAQATTQS